MTESEKLIRLFNSHSDTEMVKQFEKAVIEVINKLNQKNMWTKEKPKLEEVNRNCLLLTTSVCNGIYESQVFEIRQIISDKWYWGIVCDNGDEWGDYEDLEADYYMLIDFPVLSSLDKGVKKT